MSKQTADTNKRTRMALHYFSNILMANTALHSSIQHCIEILWRGGKRGQKKMEYKKQSLTSAVIFSYKLATHPFFSLFIFYTVNIKIKPQSWAKNCPRSLSEIVFSWWQTSELVLQSQSLNAQWYCARPLQLEGMFSLDTPKIPEGKRGGFVPF